MILVTCGAGFIGSNLVAALCGRGLPIVVCDRLESGDKWRNVAKRDLHDVIAPEPLGGWLEQRKCLDAIFHLGAISATTETDADLIYEVNVRLSTVPWDWSVASGTPFIYVSSAATYGDGAAGFDDDESLKGLARLRPFERIRLEQTCVRPSRGVSGRFRNVSAATMGWAEVF